MKLVIEHIPEQSEGLYLDSDIRSTQATHDVAPCDEMCVSFNCAAKTLMD